MRLHLLLLLILILILVLPNTTEPFTPNIIIGYCINLPDNTERWKNMVEQQKALSFPINKIEAVDTRGDKWLQYSSYITPEANEKLIDTITTKKRKEHPDLTPGAIGCFLSHLKIYKEIMKQPDEDKIYLILEDDTEMVQDFEAQMIEEIKHIPKDWDIVLLNYIIRKRDPNVKNKILSFFLTDCYIITKKAIKKILENHTLIYNQIDSFLGDLADKNVLAIYCSQTKLAKQNPKFGTNIQLYRVKN